MAMAEKGRVCVTGIGGFVASWVVKLLLSKHYFAAHETDEKYAHLHRMKKESKHLRPVKADLLDYDSLLSATDGCSGVFHVASPAPPTTVPNPKVEPLEPAVKGTLNVLKACVETKVKRVVCVSSSAAVALNPGWPKERVMDETRWSVEEYSRTTKNWCCLSKTEAEIEAWEFSLQTGLDIVSICPTVILGPIPQSNISASTLILLKLMREGYESLENKLRMIVDVRDVAEAIILAYEKPEAEGRYKCTAHLIKAKILVDKLRSLYPQYNHPKRGKFSIKLYLFFHQGLFQHIDIFPRAIHC